MEDEPTFEVASVRELRVVDFPEDGFPTKPIRGSRGIVTYAGQGCRHFCISIQNLSAKIYPRAWTKFPRAAAIDISLAENSLSALSTRIKVRSLLFLVRKSFCFV